MLDKDVYPDCSVCGSPTPWRCGHQEETNTCTDCGERFDGPVDLMRHEAIVHNPDQIILLDPA